jgi:hypothetical protein
MKNRIINYDENRGGKKIPSSFIFIAFSGQWKEASRMRRIKTQLIEKVFPPTPRVVC